MFSKRDELSQECGGKFNMGPHVYSDIGTITLLLYAYLLVLCVPMTSVERVGVFQLSF